LAVADEEVIVSEETTDNKEETTKIETLEKDL
jgi:hypothetical protein